MAHRSRRPQSCTWCGRQVPDAGVGRRRLYCRQSCRQRAYEQRNAVKGTTIPENAVVLSVDEATAVSDRAYEVRCAAEDIFTALTEGADNAELTSLCEELMRLAREAERLR